MIVATFAKQSMVYDVMDIQLVKQRISINIMILSFDLDRNGEVSLIEDFEATVHKGLVKVKHQTLAPLELRLNRRK